MTQYLLSVHHDYGTEFPPLEEMQPVFAAVDRFNAEAAVRGRVGVRRRADADRAGDHRRQHR